VPLQGQEDFAKLPYEFEIALCPFSVFDRVHHGVPDVVEPSKVSLELPSV
jgi:hypothetical protein